MKLLAKFEGRNMHFWIALEFALIVVVGTLDLLTGYEIEISFFYLIPISLAAWFANRRLGLAASLTSAVVWLITQVIAKKPYPQHVIAWNTLIIFSFFFTVAYLLSLLKETLERERELACTDYLTGAVNSRVFFDLLQIEINRSQRYGHPFTLAYIDIDNFKDVNDQFGHTAGDQVLRAVVDQARKHLRKSDVIARLGGDEFAVLLPETDQESAQAALSKIQHDISEGTRQGDWAITLSIGVLTCANLSHTADKIIRMADDLMYSVKRDSKNAIKYAVYADNVRAKIVDTPPQTFRKIQ
jgi:diguanylate cyclase (GGDEF)-like protein